MDPSFLNNPIFQSIPKEKQQFLQAFAARSHTGTANELASQLSSAAMEARSKGLIPSRASRASNGLRVAG